MSNKTGQIQVTFNWFYVLIAGAVILLFFAGIAFKQKAASEERLTIDVVEVMDSIFTAAGVSEKTKNFIDTSGLVDYTFYFRCSEGIGEFGIEGKPARADAAVMPVFAPENVRTDTVISWSLPYRMPFKVSDFLFVTSVDHYYVLTGSDVGFIDEFLNATQGFTIDYLSDISAVQSAGHYAVRIIDTSGTVITQTKKVPEGLVTMDDSKVSAVQFVGAKQVNYFQKEGDVWKLLNKNPIQLISIDDERDAAKYGALFAEDGESYQCNMQKAYDRLALILKVYAGEDINSFEVDGKLGELKQYYDAHPELSFTSECKGFIELYDDNLINLVGQYKNAVDTCSAIVSSCPDLITPAQKIRDINTQMQGGDCISLY